MPGLSQLKQFNSDILSLGDEITIRASRGEKPVRVPIPKEIKDVNDSEDFVLGMPEKEAEVETSSVDEDLSDLMGLASDNKSDNSQQETPSFAAPDLSNLLGPMDNGAGSDEESGMPDLSMFMDEPEPEEIPVEEEEPEEVSIADMGLDALLSGFGFDGSEGSSEQEEQAEEEEDPLAVIDEDLKELDEAEEIEQAESISEAEEISNPLSEIEKDLGIDLGSSSSEQKKNTGDALDLDDILGTSSEDISSEPVDDALNLDELDDLENLDNIDTDNSLNLTEEIPELVDSKLDDSAETLADDFDLNNLGLDTLESDVPDSPDLQSVTAETSDTLGSDATDSLDLPVDMSSETFDAVEPDADVSDTMGSDSIDSFDLPVDTSDNNTFGVDETFDDLDNITDLEIPEMSEVPSEDIAAEDFGIPVEESVTEDAQIPAEDDFNLDNLGLDDLSSDATDSFDTLGADATDSLDLPEDMSSETFDAVEPDADVSDTMGSDSIDSFDLPVDTSDDNTFGVDETFDDLDNITDLEIPEMSEVPSEDIAAEEFGIPVEKSVTEDAQTPAEDDFNLNDLGLDDLSSDATDSFDTLGSDATDSFDLPVDMSSETFDAVEPDADVSDTMESDATDSLDLPEDTSDGGFNLDDLGTDDLESLSLPGDDASLDFGTDATEPLDTDSSSADLNLDDLGDFSTDTSSDLLTEAQESLTDDSAEGFNLDDITGDMDLPSGESDLPETEDSSLNEGFGSDFGGADAADSLDSIDFGTDTSGMDDYSAPEGLFDSKNDEIPDYGDDSLDIDLDSADGEIETFDTSGMDDIDFGIQDTDSQIGGDTDFDLGNSDDIPLEGSDFEIPGFSDVATAKDEKHGSPKLQVSGKKKPEEEKLPDNTLSDEQYKQFLKNLNEYPLNVRLAFENLIVQDEFTDDAEFEIIEKILNKVPARQLASSLEKMLDISIPVPRDFEHRTAEEYEAYKKSIQYQLKNRIIPAVFVGMICVLVGIGIFNFAKNCIYRPLKATSLYKQGYALLQADEYPQAEMKFNEAVKKRLIKKWFYNYARGYRDHKQYQRAASMYENILRSFNHDKDAGLEYAGMELDDLANYEKAEEIVRREVLDYHINDADGILTLGDVFLEWGTEKDPSKLPLAREQYATLLQLYKPNDLYYSRMMRYFIRTDNLRQVLQLKSVFDNREKSLSSADWTELSGYLLDKMYGSISPSEEYLRSQIEGLRSLLIRAVKTDPSNPVALYNLSRYYIKTGENQYIESTLKSSIDRFNEAESLKSRDIYKYIDAYRLLGEHYVDSTDYLKAQEQYAEGITLYTAERDNAGFAGNKNIGHLYADLADINYFVSGNYNEAIENYKHSIELEYDNPSIRYRVGYIQYKNKNYGEALGSFMKSGEGSEKSRNLLLAMANTLSLRGDDYAAEGYYNQLIGNLDNAIAKKGIVFPQTSEKDYDIVNTYLSAANNYGVTLYRLAKRTGNSDLNAQAIVQFQQSVRAWDALTRNQQTLVRMDGSNLAYENIKYITHQFTEFEPAIYIDIPKALTDEEGIN